MKIRFVPTLERNSPVLPGRGSEDVGVIRTGVLIPRTLRPPGPGVLGSGKRNSTMSARKASVAGS